MAEDNKKSSPYFLPKSDIAPDGQIKNTGEWIKMEQPGAFINNLDTIKVDPQARNTVFNALIAGVPSPWARAKITYFALQQDDNDDPRALMSCYRALRDEWRGLIATLVCRADQFYLSKPVTLPHLDSDELADVRADRLDILSTYGDMLFREASLWYTAEPSVGRQREPSIQLLYFIDQGQKKLVGATSPFSIFFTAVNYDIKNANGITGISDLGKFEDPTKDPNPNEEQKQNYRKIYTFLDRLRSNLSSFRNAMEAVAITGPDTQQETEDNILHIYEALQKEINNWAAQISRNLGEKETSLRVQTEPLNLTDTIIPKGPLSRLFTNNQKYIWDGSQFVNAAGDTDAAVDIDTLFTDSKVLTCWRPANNDWAKKYEESPVYFLHTKDENGRALFLALPLSPKGVKMFGKHLPTIISGTNPSVSITAEVKGKVVDVRLNMRIDDQLSGSKRDSELLLKTYTMIPGSIDHHIFAWPNFKSVYWNEYYYYSELPTNITNTVRAIPEFEGKEFGLPAPGSDVYPADKAPTAAEIAGRQGIVYKVKYPVGKVGSDKHCYEIISSDTPLNYISLVTSVEGADQISGRLIVKVDVEGSHSMHEITGRPQYKAYVGIDFGSTNTCAYYRVQGTNETRPLPFSNMRLALLNFDNAPGLMAEPNELLFISNEEPVNPNGQVKSWLHRHAPEYIEQARRNEAIVGGIPVNETNIVVADMNETEITTNAGKLCYNMKWLTGAAGEDRNSFLRMLWLHISADLFRLGIEPVEIRWSYPGAKQKSDINDIFDNCKFNPHEGQDKKVRNVSFTESEAVCRFAGRPGGTTPQDDRFVLGIDIGGSTSDILILGKEPGSNPRLYSQCSVRLAAGKFFSAIKNSEKFRKALVAFHNSTEVQRFSQVPVDGIQILADGTHKERAPYYLNNVFDRLNKAESRAMYKYMRNYVPFVFTMPAFVTGLLCYYSGEMLRAVILKNGINERIREIKVQYFGKGGRLFEWLHDIDSKLSTQYLTACLVQGMGDVFTGKNIEFRWPEEDAENKTEVAQGLVLMGEGQRYLGITNDTQEGSNNGPDLGVFGGDGMFGDDMFGSGMFGGGFGDTPAQTSADGAKDMKSDNSDIIGEKGIRYYKDGSYHSLDETDVLKFKVNDLNFSECKNENFTKFIYLFCKYLVSAKFVEQSVAQQLFNDIKRIDIGNFLANDADNENSESHHMPIFMAEGLYYLERVLLPTVFNQ